MVYSITKSFYRGSGEEVKKKVPVLITDASSGKMECLPLVDIIADVDNLQGLQQLSIFVKLCYSTSENKIYPILEQTASTDCTPLLDPFIQAYNSVSGNVTAEVISSFAAKIVRSFNGNTELANAVVEAVFAYIAYTKGSGVIVDKNIPISFIDIDCLAETKAYLDSVGTPKIFSKIKESDNVTKKQENCTDELFIRLPYNFEFDTDSEIISLIPSMDKVAVPYPAEYKCAYTSDYKNLGVIPETMYGIIEGFPENNTLPVQSNEQTYYDAICDWIKYNAKETYGTIPEDEAKIIPDELTELYLLELISVLYSRHWGHNPNVPSINISDDDSDDDDAGYTDSRYEYRAHSSSIFDDTPEIQQQRVNAITLLRDFVQRAAKEIGYKAYAEAVVKLARWGTRKCSGLVFDGYNKIFQLGTNSISAYIGSISDYECAPDADGNLYSIKSLIVCDARITDNEWLRSAGMKQNTFTIPVAVCLATEMHHKNGGTDCSICRYYSMIDFIIMLMKGAKVAGCSVDNLGKISAPSIPVFSSEYASVRDVVNFAANPNKSLLYDPIYISDAIRDLYIELEVKGQQENHFSLLANKLENGRLGQNLSKVFYTKEELDEYTKFGVNKQIASKTIGVSYRILSMILPIYVSVEHSFESTGGAADFSNLLNLYKDAMLEQDYAGENGFLKFPKVAPEHFRTLVPGYTAPSETSTETAGYSEKEASILAEVNKAATAPLTAFSGTKQSPSITQAPAAETVQAVQTAVSSNQINEPDLEALEDDAPILPTRVTWIKSIDPNLPLVGIVNKNNVMVGLAAAYPIVKKNPDGTTAQGNAFILTKPGNQQGQIIKRFAASGFYVKILTTLAKIEDNQEPDLFFDSVQTITYYAQQLKSMIAEGSI